MTMTIDWYQKPFAKPLQRMMTNHHDFDEKDMIWMRTMKITFVVNLRTMK